MPLRFRHLLFALAAAVCGCAAATSSNAAAPGGSSDPTRASSTSGVPVSSTAPAPTQGTSAAAAPTTVTLVWRDAAEFTVEGRGFKDTKGKWDRLPARADATATPANRWTVPPAVWTLSKNTAGVAVRFVTDAKEIHADWDAGEGMWHMPPSGMSGLDAYARTDEGTWKYVGTGRPKKTRTQHRMIGSRPGVETEYMVFLPLYNGVSDLKFGFPEGATVKPGPARPAGQKPIVFYGTSITQGGCASRSGMGHCAILTRKLDREIINLGFSGSGKMEPALAELITEIDAAVYVLETLPNMTIEMVETRVEPFVRRLRQDHPRTPILLVENYVMSDKAEQNKALRRIYEGLVSDGVTGLHYLRSKNVLHDDGEEGTVDGVHPTDLGFVRLANQFEPVLREILEKSGR